MHWLRQIVFRPWWTMTKLHLSTMFGKPYLKVFIFQTDRVGNVGIDAHFNIHFIYELDNAYELVKATHYDKHLDDNAKVAIYLSDNLGQIADQYLPVDSEVQDLIDESLAGNIPPMTLQGGEEVRQVVDLADRKRSSSLDIEMG
jgi:hypothetical protein